MLTFTPIGTVAVILYLGIAFSIGIRKRIPIRRQALVFLLFLYLLGVLAVTLFPIPVTPASLMQRHLSPGQPFYNLIPFDTIGFMLKGPDHFNAFLNIAGNIALFGPFGFLIPHLFKKLNRASRIIPLGFAVTFIVESCQFLISYTLNIFFRSFDVDDLMLNTLGVIIGFMFFRLIQPFVQVRQEPSQVAVRDQDR